MLPQNVVGGGFFVGLLWFVFGLGFVILFVKNLITSFTLPEARDFQQQDLEEHPGDRNPHVGGEQCNALPSRGTGLHTRQLDLATTPLLQTAVISRLPRVLHACCSATQPLHLQPFWGHAAIPLESSRLYFGLTSRSDVTALRAETQTPRPAEDQR